MKSNVEREPLNARVNLRVARAFDIEIARRRISKQQAVEEALRLWITAQVKQTEGLPLRAPILDAVGREPYTISPQEVDDALLG